MNGGDKMNEVKKYRKSNSLTQGQLAELLEVSKDYVGMIERGKRTPGFKLAKKIADCFLVTVDDLNFFNDTSNKTYDEAS